MDCVSKRYHNPFEILDLNLELNRLLQFIIDLNRIRTDEQIWDVWLYKCQDKGYEEFRKAIGVSNVEQSSDLNADIERAVQSSREALSEFN